VQVNEKFVQHFYEEYYEDVFEEVAAHGEVENLNVCGE
jgi:splicing factor U2AF subunit